MTKNKMPSYDVAIEGDRELKHNPNTSWLIIVWSVMSLVAALALGSGCAAMGDAPTAETSGQSAPRPNGPPTEPGDDQPPSSELGSAPNLGQGGSQDIGELRQVLESGGIPSPDVLDEVGFFNVHRLDFPNPECGEDVCIHGLVGMMGNMISGSQCTLLLIGMNTPIQPETMERPPLDLVIALDTSAAIEAQMPFVGDGLTAMLGELREDDTVSLVTFDDQVRFLYDGLGPEETVAGDWFSILRTAGSSDLYGGLRAAFELAGDKQEEGRQARVLLVSGGPPTAGLTSPQRLADMAEGFSAQGIALTTLGVGNADGVVLRSLTQSGAGNSYFAPDASAAQEVLTQEINSFAVAIAQDVRISFSGSEDYWLGRIHGTSQSRLLDDRRGVIDIPSLFLAQRTSDEDQEEGRRGGGGGIMIELLPNQPELSRVEVGLLTIQYRVPGTDQWVEQEVEVVSDTSPAEVTSEGAFETPSVEKAFVMLNIFVGFEMAAVRAENADYRSALQVLHALDVNVGLWLDENPDLDIADDYDLLTMFIANVESEWDSWMTQYPEYDQEFFEPETRQSAGYPTPAPEPWPQD